MRDVLAGAFMCIILIWFGFLAWVVVSMRASELDAMVALGVGVATGVFLGAFKDMWQFYFRKAGPKKDTAKDYIRSRIDEALKGRKL